MLSVIRSGYFVYREAPEGTLVPFRTARNYELELSVTSGSQTYIGEQLVERSAGTFLLTKPGQKRKNLQAFECHYIHFSCDDAEFAQKYLDRLPEKLCPTNMFQISEQFMQVDTLCSKNEFRTENQLIAGAVLLQILMALYLSVQNISSINSRYTQYIRNVSAACSYIGRHFNENIKIKDIAKAAALSPSFTYVAFRELTGQTPHAYLLSTRISEAKRQLVYTKKSVSQISMECGFKESNYLNYIFKKHFDMTPNQYRTQMQYSEF